MTTSEFVDAVPPPALNEGLLITNPWVLITALLIAFLILWLGWHFGSVRNEEDLLAERKKVSEEIYKRINEKARTAAAAPRNKLTSAAHDLWDEIEKLLGPVVALTPFGKRAVALKRALDGNPTPRVHDEPEPHGADSHGDHGGHGAQSSHAENARADGAKSAAAASAGAQSTSALASQVHISIHGPGGATDRGGSTTPGRDAVRDAVIDICDYWSRATMKDELHAAQKALLRMPPPKPKPKISGSGGH